MKQKKGYQWIWWVLVILILTGVVWLCVIRKGRTDYMDGTLVMYTNDMDTEGGGGYVGNDISECSAKLCD